MDDIALCVEEVKLAKSKLLEVISKKYPVGTLVYFYNRDGDKVKGVVKEHNWYDPESLKLKIEGFSLCNIHYSKLIKE